MTTDTRPVAFLVGASSGLGRALACALVKSYQLILLASSRARLEETDDMLRKNHGVSATLVPMNLERHDDIDAMVAGIWRRFARLDLLCGLAATIAEAAPLAHTDPKAMLKMTMVNTLAHFRLLRACDAMLKNTMQSRVMMITGGMRDDGQTPNAFTAGFDASKAALQKLTQSYALELGQSEVKAVTIDPGCFESRLRRKVFPGQTARTLPQASKKAQAIAQLLRDDQFMNGAHCDI